MTPAARERSQVRTPMLLIGAVAWTLLVIEPSGTVLPAHCSAAMLGATPPLSRLPELLMVLKSPASLSAGWVLMLAAMMVPALIAPVRHVHDRSFAHRRVRAILLFATGYVAIWMPTGVMLLALVPAVRFVAYRSGMQPAIIISVIALAWQCSPVKQRCLNRNHVHTELAAFGLAADIDAFRFGLTHGIWCVGSCWALMLLSMLVSRGHVAAMAAVTLWHFAERLDRPMPPRWRFRGPARAARLAAAQASQHLQFR
jgi:predicted metal-binding membrane protein